MPRNFRSFRVVGPQVTASDDKLSLYGVMVAPDGDAFWHKWIALWTADIANEAVGSWKIIISSNSQ